MLEKLLPIGSVVLLKGGIKKLVVIGVKQISEEEPDKEYDYIGVLYPEGFLGKDALYVFNHSDINDIIFRGYENPERAEFLDTLEKIYQDIENQEKK